MRERFRHFAAIDWSGAVGEHQPGIAVAVAAAGSSAPRLIDRRWSRLAVADWIRDQAQARAPMLIGLDLSFALPFADRGAYLPGWAPSPADARALWRLVENHAGGDPYLGAAGFLAMPGIARHFRQRYRCGDLFGTGRGRLRRCEVAAAGLQPSSCFNLVGPGQVGKSSLTGMRMLARLDGMVAIWPFDPLPAAGPVVVEIYTALALAAAGRRRGGKVRDAAALDAALAMLGSAPHPPLDRHDDHRTDALVSAAWLRRVASDARLWTPAALSGDIAATEGWTFGVT